VIHICFFSTTSLTPQEADSIIIIIKITFDKGSLQTALFTKTAPKLWTLKPKIRQYCFVDLTVLFAARKEN
jgi:hypothetical protein